MTRCCRGGREGHTVLSDITIGQYYKAQSVVHRMDARMNLILTVLFIVIIFLCRNFFSLAVMFVLTAVSILLSRVPFRMFFKSLKPIILKLISHVEGDVTVGVPEGSDIEKLEKYFLGELAGKAKGGVTVAPVKGLKAGAAVLAKGSDVKVELTDETLVALLSSQLSPKLAAVLKD